MDRFSAFAAVLQSAKALTGDAALEEEQSAAVGYASVVHAELEQVQDSAAAQDRELWELERNTWDLVQAVYTYVLAIAQS